MRPLLLLVAGLLAVPGAHRAFAQGDFRSPDGRYILVSSPDRVDGEDGHGDLVRDGLRLVDARTGRELGAYDPRARSFEVIWSPDGRLVAINADLGRLDDELTVWHVAPSGWRLARLPVALRRGDGGVRARDRLLPKAYAGRIGAETFGLVPFAERWVDSADLETSLLLDGGDARRSGHEFLASFSLVVRFFRMGSEILEEKRTSFKVL